jgi:hypothetical protein
MPRTLQQRVAGFSHEEMRFLSDLQNEMQATANAHMADEVLFNGLIRRSLLIERIREMLVDAREAATGERLSYPSDGGVEVRWRPDLLASDCQAPRLAW